MRITNSSSVLVSVLIVGLAKTTMADRDCCYLWQGETSGKAQQFHVSWTASSQTATCKLYNWGSDSTCTVETSVVDNAWLKANATVSFKEPNVFHFTFGMNNNDCEYLGDDTIPRAWDSYLFPAPIYKTQGDACPDKMF